jgi:hypothetical protein
LSGSYRLQTQVTSNAFREPAQSISETCGLKPDAF